MKKILFATLLISNCAFAQVEQASVAAQQSNLPHVLKMTSDYGLKEAGLQDWLHFEGVDYYTIKFSGKELAAKSFVITAKEIWNGKTTSETIVINSNELKGIGLDKISDTVLTLKVMGKLTPENKLKVSFIFPRFATTKEYKAISGEDYSLRNLADESKLPITYDQNFHFMSFILPYERKDGSKSWCEVGGSGKDVENWGKKFGIKHYLLFDLKFE